MVSSSSRQDPQRNSKNTVEDRMKGRKGNAEEEAAEAKWFQYWL